MRQELGRLRAGRRIVHVQSGRGEHLRLEPHVERFARRDERFERAGEIDRLDVADQVLPSGDHLVG